MSKNVLAVCITAVLIAAILSFAPVRSTAVASTAVAGPEIGRCCLPDLSCQEVTEQVCIDLGGTWEVGFCGATCATQMVGCCFNYQPCQRVSASVCQSLGGTPVFFGDCRDCEPWIVDTEVVAPNAGSGTRAVVRVWSDGAVTETFIDSTLGCSEPSTICDRTLIAGCLYDLDYSGDVDFSDLLPILAAWGPCNGGDS